MDILSEYLARGKSFLSQQLLKTSDWDEDDPATAAIIFSLRSTDYESLILLEAQLEMAKRSSCASIQTVALVRFYEELPNYPIQQSLIDLFEEALTLPGSKEHRKLIYEKLNDCFKTLCEKYSTSDLLPFYKVLHPYKDMLLDVPDIFMLEPVDMTVFQNYQNEDPRKVLELVEKAYSISKENELHHSSSLSVLAYNALVYVLKNSTMQMERIGNILRNYCFVLSSVQYNTLLKMFEDASKPKKLSIHEYIDSTVRKIKEKERVRLLEIAGTLSEYINETSEELIFEAVDNAISKCSVTQENFIAWRVISKSCYLNSVFAEYNQEVLNLKVKSMGRKTQKSQDKTNYEGGGPRTKTVERKK